MDAGLDGRRVLVAGLGVSGVAAARALAGAGAQVWAIDSGDDDRLRERAAELRRAGVAVDLDVPFEFEAEGLIGGSDLLVPSPGLPEHSPLISAALADGLDVWSEPELAWRMSDGRTRLVVVTGTNGKTTTTELLGRLLGAPAGGNIGTPLVDLLADDLPPALVVAELSSFQLRFTDTLRAEVAVLLNVASDHLDWHGDIRRYEAAKARAWACSEPGDWVVIGEDEGAQRVVRDYPPRAGVIDVVRGPPGTGQVGVEEGWIVADIAGQRSRVAPLVGFMAQGGHNLANACAAVAAAVAAGADPTTLAAALETFHPGPHRLELVAERHGVRWVDDSKATNPHAAAAALATSAGGGPVVWIAGGLAKGLSFEALEPAVRAYVAHAITIGTSGDELARLAEAWGIPATRAGTLDRAVAAADALTSSDDSPRTVLLAPACASMDQFRDYADRGRTFAALVAARGDAGPPGGQT